MTDAGVAPVSFVHGRKTLYAYATYTWTVAVVSTTAVILALDFHKQCDSPLKAWVIVFTAAVFGIVAARLLLGDESEFISEEAERMWHDGEQRQQREQAEDAPPERYWKSIVHLQRAVYLVRRLCGYLLFVWFIAGMVWVFRADTCRDTAPDLWRLSLAYALTLMAAFALSIATVCVALSTDRERRLHGGAGGNGTFGFDDAAHRGARHLRRGMTATEIEQSTTVRTMASSTEDTLVAAAAAAAASAQPARSRKLPLGSQHSVNDGSSGGGGGGGGGGGASTGHVAMGRTARGDIGASVAVDAGVSGPYETTSQSCSICLGDFVADNVLRALPCKHEFHDECIRKWLGQHRDCPLCKRGVVDTGEEGEDASSNAPTAASSASGAVAGNDGEEEEEEQAGGARDAVDSDTERVALGDDGDDGNAADDGAADVESPWWAWWRRRSSERRPRQQRRRDRRQRQQRGVHSSAAAASASHRELQDQFSRGDGAGGGGGDGDIEANHSAHRA